MTTRPGRVRQLSVFVTLGLLACAALALNAGPVLAQSGQLGELSDRIARLQRELQTLQQTVYRGTKPATGAARAVARSAAPARDSGFAATVEIRLSEFETLIRGLERRIESLEVAEHRSKGRIERMAADLEHRLRNLEQGQAPPPPVADAAGTAGRIGGRFGGGSAGLATTIIGGTTAPDAPPRPLGTIRLRKSNQPGAPPATGARPAARAGTQFASTSPILPPGEPRQQYDYALSLILNEQDFAKAEKAFTAFIDIHAEHKLAGNAYFWLGQTHFVRKDFDNAAFAFADGFKKYPRSNKAPENLFKLGMSLGRLGKTREACTTFSRLLETFPQTGKTLKTRISRQRKRLKCA